MMTTPSARPASQWVQVNCSVFLTGGPGPARPHIPWRALGQILAVWRQEQRFQRFFFVRKPPGLRLRFSVAQRGHLEPVLAAWLAEAEARNDVRGFRFTVYEPETYRFGGAAGMDLAHELFDADAASAIAYETLAEADQAALSRLDVSVALSAELFQAVLDDRAEVWDVWCRLRDAAAGGHPVAPGARRPVVGGWPQLAARMPPDLEGCIRRERDAVAALSRLLRATAESGRLDVGVRSWLVAATTFHWNRWGLPLDMVALRQTLDATVERWSPEAS